MRHRAPRQRPRFELRLTQKEHVLWRRWAKNLRRPLSVLVNETVNAAIQRAVTPIPRPRLPATPKTPPPVRHAPSGCIGRRS